MKTKIFAWALVIALVFTLQSGDVFADTDAPVAENSPTPQDESSPTSAEDDLTPAEASAAAIENSPSPSAVSEESSSEKSEESDSEKTVGEGEDATINDDTSAGGDSAYIQKIEKRHKDVRITLDDRTSRRGHLRRGMGALHDVAEFDVTERGEDYTVFADGEGGEIIKAYTDRIRYEDEEGNMEDIDTSLIPVEDAEADAPEDGGYAFTNASGDVHTWLPDDIMEKPIVLQGGGMEFSMRLVPGSLEEENAQASEATVTMEDAEDLYGYVDEKLTALTYTPPGDVNYEYMPLSDGVKEDIILESPDARSEYVYRISMKDTEAELTTAGGVVLTSEKTEELVAFIAPPNIKDSSEDAVAVVDPDIVSYGIEDASDNSGKKIPGEYDLTLKVSREYLDDEDRRYPVTIDPTVELRISGLDVIRPSMLSSAFPYDSFYAGESMKVGYHPDYGWTRMLLKFTTLMDEARGGDVSNAYLTLYGMEGSSSIPVAVDMLGGPYLSDTVTWANAPSGANYSGFIAPAYGGVANADMTAIVQAWKSGESNDGICLRASSELYAAGCAILNIAPVLTVVMSYPPEYDTIGIPPSAPKSVSVSPVYIGGWESDEYYLTVAWSGIVPHDKAAIKTIDYWIRELETDENGVHTPTDYYVVERGDDGAVLPGNASDGSALVDISDLDTDTCYSLSIGATDIHGRRGAGASMVFHIDSEEPMVAALSSNPDARNTYSGPAGTITVSWSGFQDKHKSYLQYAVANEIEDVSDISGDEPDDSEYIRIDSTDTNGSFQIDPAVAFDGSGPKGIYVRGVDMMGNVMEEPACLLFYYDISGPEASGGGVEAGPTADTYQTWIRGEDISFYVGGIKDEHVGVIDTGRLGYAITDATVTAPAIGSLAYKAATDFSLSADGKTAQFRLLAEENSLPSGNYNVHVLLYDSLGNANRAYSINYKRHCHPMNVKIRTEHDEADMEQVPDTYQGENVGVVVWAEDFRIPFMSSRVELTDRFGDIIATLKTGAIIHAAGNTYISFDSTKIKNGEYTLSFTGLDYLDFASTAQTKIYIENPIAFPEELSLKSPYVNTPEQGISWDFKGSKSVNFIRMDYLISEDDGWREVVNEYDSETKGEATLPFTPAADGEYTLSLKAVGYSKHPDAYREDMLKKTFILDRKPPEVTITAYRDGIVKGVVDDMSPVKWTAYISRKGSDDRTPIGAGNVHVKGGTLADYRLDSYPAGVYRITLSAKDEAGNASEAYYDVLKVDIEEATDKGVIRIKEFYKDPTPVNRKTKTLELAAVQPNPFPESVASWYLDGVKVGADILSPDGRTLKDDFNDGMKYKESDLHQLYAKVDSLPGPAFTGRSGNGRIAEETFDATTGADYENTEITGGGLRLVTDADKGSAVIFSANISGSFSSFKINDRSEGAVYMVKLDSAEDYVPVTPGAFIDVEGLNGERAVSDSMSVKAVLSGAGANIEYFELDAGFLRQDRFFATYVELYRPENLTAGKVVNYKPTIRWEVSEGRPVPSDIVYEVYKGTNEGFIMDGGSRIASGLTEPYYQDINANPEIAWYKVRAVYRTGGAAPVTEYSTDATALCPFTFDLTKVSDTIGEVANRAYIDFNTPNANMRIEKSAGNLFYTKTDFNISSSTYSPSITRVYNSYANIETEFGKGFDHTYNGALVKVKSGKFGKEDYIVFKDSDGRLYPFTRKVRSGAYTLKDPNELRLTPEAITHSLKYNTGVGGGAVPPIKTAYSLRINNTTFKYFNERGELVLERDDKENFLVYTRDENTGLLYGIVNNAAESLRFTYDEGSDKVNRVSMKGGSYFTYTYSNGYLVSQRHYPSGGGQSIGYSYSYGEGRESEGSYAKLETVWDAEGNIYSISYSGDKVSEAKYPSGEMLKLVYKDLATDVTKSKRGKFISKETSEFSERGFVTKDIFPNGSETRYTYKDGLLRDTITQVQDVTFDGKEVIVGDVREFTNTTKYDDNGNVISEKDKQDKQNITYTFDEQGCMLTERTENGDGADGLVTTIIYTYTPVKGPDGLNLGYDKVTTRTRIGTDASEEEESVEDSNGNEISNVSEENGVKTETTTRYDDHGNVIAEETAVGNAEQLKTGAENSYDAMNRVTRTVNYEEDTKGVKSTTSTITYSYDGFGRVTSTNTTYPGGDAEQQKTSYNKNGSALSTTDKDGIMTLNVYDEMNKAVQTRTVGGGRDMTTTVSETYADVTIETYAGKKKIPNALVTISTDAAGDKSYTYADNMGRAVRSEAAGMLTDTNYSIDGKTILTITMPVSYDKSGEGMRRMNASAYDTQGRNVASVIQPEIDGGRIRVGPSTVVTTSKYDDQGNAISQTDEDGNTVKFEYYSPHRDMVTKVTLPDPSGSNVTRIAYTDFTTTTTDANGNISVDKINDQGEAKSVTDYGVSKDDASKIATKYEYNVSGRLARTTYANGNYESYGYDRKGRQITTASYYSGGALDFKTSTGYDSKDRVTSEIEYGSNSVATRRTDYTYNIFGDVLSRTEADYTTGKTSRYGYTYDKLGRVSEVSYPSGDSLNGVKFSYGKYSRLVGVDAATDGGNIPIRRYAYDKWGQVLSLRDYVEPAEGGAECFIKRYAYDIFGRTVAMTTATDTAPGTELERYSYTYDKKSQVTSERVTIAGSGTDLLKAYAYDSLGRLISTEVSAHVPSEETLEGISKDYIAQLHLGTPMDLAREWEDGLFPHLRTADGSFLTLKKKTYTYDKVGNRIAETVSRGDEEAAEPKGYAMLLAALGEEPEEAVVRTSSFGEFNRLLYTNASGDKGVNRTGYSYDAIGNQTGESVVTSEGAVLSAITSAYDSAGRLTRTTITGQDGANTSVTANSYNAAGQRTRKTVTSGGSVEVTNYYYQDGVVSYTTNASGKKTSHNIIGSGGNIIATKRYEGEYAGKFYLYGKDTRGSVTAIYGEGGEYITGYNYDDFGQTKTLAPAAQEVTSDENTSTTTPSTETQAPFYNEVCYTGGIYDESTGLYYLNARYYNPEDGRFTTVDTYRGDINDPSTLHLYAYCANNPINFIDPTGHDFERIAHPILLTALDLVMKTSKAKTRARNFGYNWDRKTKMYYARKDAWQRSHGYGELYDIGAQYVFNIDSQPYYFDDVKNNKTWLIEYWMGDYWGAAGGEIGVYVYNGILPLDKRASTIFFSSEGSEEPFMSFRLADEKGAIFTLGSMRNFWRCGMAPYRNFYRNTMELQNIKIKFNSKKYKGKNSVNEFVKKSMPTSWAG